jgi:sigma-B regulation protein RsbU (phosphoserine phosphatase)
VNVVSVRLKILAIVLGFFALIAAAFAVYSLATTANYRQLRTSEVSGIVAYESERVGKAIAEMERNAIDLALAGYQFYRSQNPAGNTGISVSVENFSAFTAAIGGGIWFEPYALDAAVRRLCYYAFFDPEINAVRHDPDFATAEYDYHTQMWYETIAAGLGGKNDTVWTEPYFDDTGTNALMTTVGAGIYNDRGRFVGMSTVDWEIQSVVNRLSAIKPTENSFALLASPKDDYVISNTHESGFGHVGSLLSALSWYHELRFSADGVDISEFDFEGRKYLAFSRLFDNGWLFSVQIPAQEIFAEIEKRNNLFSAIIAISCLALLALTAYLLSLLLGRPLRKLTSGVAELGGGNLDKQITVPSKDEFGTLAEAFNKMTVDLKASIEQSAKERAEKERIGAELNVATQIQSSMLPCLFPAFPDRTEFDIYAGMQPAKEVGGDFYDFFLIDNNTLAVVIADVSGKGVPAALFMVITKTLLKNNAQYGKSPKEVFETVNNLLYENNDAGMFVTAILGYLDIPSGRFIYVNAGHNLPLVKRGAMISPGKRFDWLKEKTGFVLAGMEDIYYRQNEIILETDDELFFYTDGVTEAVNSKNDLFGDPRLLETVNNYLDLPLREFCLSVKHEIDKFAAGAEQSDDITMLVLRYQGEN